MKKHCDVDVNAHTTCSQKTVEALAYVYRDTASQVKKGIIMITRTLQARYARNYDAIRECTKIRYKIGVHTHNVDKSEKKKRRLNLSLEQAVTIAAKLQRHYSLWLRPALFRTKIIWKEEESREYVKQQVGIGGHCQRHWRSFGG